MTELRAIYFNQEYNAYCFYDSNNNPTLEIAKSSATPYKYISAWDGSAFRTWVYHYGGGRYTACDFNRWCELNDIPDSEIVELKLKYGYL